MIEMQDLKILQKYVALTIFLKDAGLSYSGIMSRMKNGKELTTVESKKIKSALAGLGLKYNRGKHGARLLGKQFGVGDVKGE